MHIQNFSVNNELKYYNKLIDSERNNFEQKKKVERQEKEK